MPTLRESKIEFDFSDQIWATVKKVDEHPDYKKIEILNGTKAVDFLGFCDNDLVFIEVKNFRGSSASNNGKLANNGELLMTEVGRKVKDTVATVIGGARNSTHEKNDWKIMGEHLVNSNRSVAVVLWLEENSPIEKRSKAGHGIYTNKLKSKVKWLTGGCNVLVTSSHYHDIDGLNVTLLPN